MVGEKNSQERYLLIIFSVAVTFVTLCLTAYAAYLSNSVTLLADFLKCLVEFIAILIAFIILTRTRTLDAVRYNFGFGKLEQLSSTFVALALFCSGVLCIVTAVDRLSEPKLVSGAEFGLLLGALSVLGNGYMWSRFHRLNKESVSPVTDSQSQLFFSKLMASGVVVLSLICSMQAKEFPILIYADALGSLMLAGYLLTSAHALATHSIADLVDRSLDESLQLEVLRILVEHEDQYSGFQGIRSRQIGNKRFVQIFLRFRDERTFGDARPVVLSIRKAIESEIPDSEVLIIPVWQERILS